MKSELLKFDGMRTGGAYVSPRMRNKDYWSADFEHLDAPNTIAAGGHKSYTDTKPEHGSVMSWRE